MILGLQYRCVVTTLVFLGMLLESFANPRNIPVQRFEVPFFSENGARIASLVGDRADIHPEECIILENVTFEFTKSMEGLLSGSIIQSPQVTIDMHTKIIQSPYPLQVEGENFRLYGSSWHYSSAESTLFIEKDIRLTLKAALKLKP